MSAKFNMDAYVDVAERIANFNDAYPDGCLQTELTRLEDGWLCKAYAYRTPEDSRPGIGHAFEPVPGKTPYTKDSEAMNAETSAWGRAIVALGFETKKGQKVASRQEVQAREPAPTVDTSALKERLLALTDELGTDAARQLAQAAAKHEGDEAWFGKAIAAAEKNLAEKKAA